MANFLFSKFGYTGLLGLSIVVSACAGDSTLSLDGQGGSGSGGSLGRGHAGNSGQGGTAGSSVCPGALCDIYCEHGNRVDDNGCALCACNPPPTCPLRPCPAIECANGYAVDDAGCPTCSCNPVGTCSAEACGPIPPVVLYCPDGSEQRAICGVRSDGGCGWSWLACESCPEIRCDIACPHGHKVNEQGCALCECNTGPAPCSQAECAAAALPAVGCPGGGSPIVRCERNGNNQCTWNVVGCECPAVACLLFCPYGFARDASGCETCSCNPPPRCDPDACGPPTPGAPLCPDGSIQGQICQRNDQGTCSWTQTPCPTVCSELRTRAACEADSQCQWLEPGCNAERLPAAGCFQRVEVGCEQRSCSNGKSCKRVTVDHCAGRPGLVCSTCASPIDVCL